MSIIESHTNAQTERYRRIMNPDHPLCREDIIWMLDFMKKKVADEDPHLVSLPQPLLLRNFQYFAEAAMLLLHNRSTGDEEAERLRNWLGETAYGNGPFPPVT
ncbi:hypothetical protein [Paenibacillus gansuensis]|uniref:Uncharacterized protein n=1 Tax=Paenibacillus gansuensis TaxID=306542 RepID=A0ABW5PDE3_9BACL